MYEDDTLPECQIQFLIVPDECVEILRRAVICPRSFYEVAKQTVEANGSDMTPAALILKSLSLDILSIAQAAPGAAGVLPLGVWPVVVPLAESLRIEGQFDYTQPHNVRIWKRHVESIDLIDATPPEQFDLPDCDRAVSGAA